DFDHGLNNAVARIREVLDDSSDTPRYVETIPRRGYRFIAPLADLRPATVPPAVEPAVSFPREIASPDASGLSVRPFGKGLAPIRLRRLVWGVAGVGGCVVFFSFFVSRGAEERRAGSGGILVRD